MAGVDERTVQGLKDLANKLRIHSIQSTNVAGSGHPTSCTSAAEIMSVLFFHTMRYKVHSPRDPANDRFVLSKGHAAPILYAAWAEAGLFSTSELMNLRKISSDLEGHPTPRLNFVDVATGSLGQGLSFAAGMAYTGKYWDKADYRVYCLLGDGESAEGSVFEALSFSSLYKLDNLVAIFDVNKQGQSGWTAYEHDLDTYKRRMESLGWYTIIVDGTNVEEIIKVLEHVPRVKDTPTCVLAKTYKGSGCPGVEDQLGFHGKALGAARGDEAVDTLMKKIVNPGAHGLYPNPPTSDVPAVNISNIRLSSPPDYKLGQKLAIRIGYTNALVKIGQNNNRVVVMDADMKNSTFSEIFMKKFPERFVECYIAEQNMVSAAIGAATRDRTVVFASTFGTFLTRAYDQIRMGAISQTNITIAGSHCGISIGPDGPSQMALEDIAMFRSIPGCTVFYPSDVVAVERAVELAANQKGMCFIRVTRPDMAVLYKNDETFEVGKAKIVRQSNRDQVTIVAAGMTLVEALKAADQLAPAGIQVRVIDPFTIKPLDVETIRQSALQTGGRIITVEDHYYEGGIGEAVSAAFSEDRGISVRRLAVQGVPRSGTCAELFDMFGISANHVVEAVREIIKS